MSALRPGFMRGPRPGAQIRTAAPVLGQGIALSEGEKAEINGLVLEGYEHAISGVGDLKYQWRQIEAGNLENVPFIGRFMSRGEMLFQLHMVGLGLISGLKAVERAAGPYLTPESKLGVADAELEIIRFVKALPVDEMEQVKPEHDIFSVEHADAYTEPVQEIATKIEREVATIEGSRLPGPAEPGGSGKILVGLALVGAAVGFGYWAATTGGR